MTQPLSACQEQAILRFLDNDLDLQEQTAFERHLDSCDHCCERLCELTAAKSSWDDVASHLIEQDHLSAPSMQEETTSRLALDFLDPTDDPRMLGRYAGYEIVGVIGEGGMGIVLKGLDRALNRYVAIKVLLPHFASSAAARQRFAREAKAAAAVVHENVIAIYGVSVDDRGCLQHASDGESRARLPYLVMPYVGGESLQKRLDRCGSLSVSEVLRISMQVALGLAAAHEQGLVHRDIKPANILLPADIERVKITDFGLARTADDASLTRSGVIAGTPQYMSPEQALGEAITTQSDLFSLGSLMYVMCTGRVPFRAETPLGVIRRIVDEAPRPIRDINLEAPEWLCRIIGELHSKSPKKRPEAAEVARLLRDCLAHLQQPATVPLPDKVNAAAAEPKPCAQDFSPPRFSQGMFTMIATFFIGLIGLSFLPFVTQPGTNHCRLPAGESHRRSQQ